MGDARKPTALDDQDKKLDPQNFAYISDDTYTAVEVEAQTQVGAGASRRSAHAPVGVGGNVAARSATSRLSSSTGQLAAGRWQ